MPPNLGPIFADFKPMGPVNIFQLVISIIVNLEKQLNYVMTFDLSHS